MCLKNRRNQLTRPFSQKMESFKPYRRESHESQVCPFWKICLTSLAACLVHLCFNTIAKITHPTPHIALHFDRQMLPESDDIPPVLPKCRPFWRIQQTSSANNGKQKKKHGQFFPASQANASPGILQALAREGIVCGSQPPLGRGPTKK